jgi:hypothetical protein
VTIAEYIAFATLLMAIVAIIFNAGRKDAKDREAQSHFKKDLDGLGKRERDDIAREERRWLFGIADSVEEADSHEKRTRLAERIRQDAYRK